MKDFLNAYKRSSLFAMFCGIITVFLGIAALLFRTLMVSYIAVSVTMIINTVLHYESYICGVWKEKKKQMNVLSMAIAETVLLLFFGLCLTGMGWTEFVILFSVYLVFNGTSLIAIPSAFARNCGIAATIMGVAMYIFGRDSGTVATILVGLNLVINGAERVVMALMGGRKKK